MNPSERSSHPSRAQIQVLIEFLQKNPGLAKGFSKVPSARDATRRQWERLAFQLNSMGGSVKSWKRWTKYWADKKSAVKKKAALRSAVQRRTGGGHEATVELTEIEEQILSVMGGEGFAVGDRHLAIDPFQASPFIVESPTTQDVPVVIDVLESPSIDTTEEAMVAIDVPVSLHSETNLQCVAGTSYVSDRQSYVLPIAVARPTSSTPASAARPVITSPQVTNVTTVPPSTTQSRQPGTSRESSPTNRALPRNTTPRRRRRLITTAASPPSQRRSQFRNITERFLRVEEQRLELEGRQTAVMEQNAESNRMIAESNHMIAQGLTTIAEAIKLFAEAINKK